MQQRLDELLQHCTVKLKVPGEGGWGSGFCVAPGLILTCAHVVKGLEQDDKVQVGGYDGTSLPDATLLQKKLPDYDLALLQMSPPPSVDILPCVYLDPAFEPFSRFYTFGYADHFPDGASVTSECEGIAFEQGKSLILFKSGQIRPGISGSALLNWTTGQVCGIVKFTRDRSTDLGGGAIPVQVILEQFPQLKELQQEFHKQDNRWLSALQIPTEEIWQKACRNWINAHRNLVTNLFAGLIGKPLALDEIHVQLGLLKRRRKPIASKSGSPEAGSQVDYLRQTERLREKETIVPISYEDFYRKALTQRQSSEHQSKPVAIIGEAGSGKTVQLLKIADWVLDATEDLPIWISLGKLGQKSLRDYVSDDWVPSLAARFKENASNWQNDLQQRLQDGKIWLLLDGADEMRGLNPVDQLTQALQRDQLFAELWKQGKVVLTCRTNIWDIAGTAPLKFDTYKMLDFSSERGQQFDQVKQFIKRWFTAINYPEWGESLQRALDAPGKDRIKDLARNPLRLGLLCVYWKEKQGNFPETKAGLYQRFVESFYKISENSKGIVLAEKQKDLLNQALGQLARQAIDEGHQSILPHDLIHRELVNFQQENRDLAVFELARQFDWIIDVGGDPEDRSQSVYAFLHPSFQEYFAAMAIDDWDFFLPRQHKNRPVAGKPYRIFEPKWQEVILLWFGRSDISSKEKEKFIEDLLTFQDGCKTFSPIARLQVKNFYEYRAFLMATLVVSEFRDCTLAKAIVNQLIKWICLPTYKLLINNLLLRYVPLGSLYDENLRALEETNHQLAIENLNSYILSQEDDNARFLAATLLLSFIPKNKIALSEMLQIIQSTNNFLLLSSVLDYFSTCQIFEGGFYVGVTTYFQRLQNLRAPKLRVFSVDLLSLFFPHIFPNIPNIFSSLNTFFKKDYCLDDPITISALVRLLKSTEIKNLMEFNCVASGLKKLPNGNPTAIVELEKILESEENKWQKSAQESNIYILAAVSLSRIDPENSKSRLALENTVDIAQTIRAAIEIIIPRLRRGLATGRYRYSSEIPEDAYNLGKYISQDSPWGHEYFSEQASERLRIAAESLGKVDHGNQKAIKVLEHLTDSNRYFWQAKCLLEFFMICEFGEKSGPKSYQWVVEDAIDKLQKKERAAAKRSLSETHKREIEAAKSLWKIDPGNPRAISTLLRLLESLKNTNYQSLVIDSLKNICLKDATALKLLWEFLKAKLRVMCRSSSEHRWSAHEQKLMGNLDKFYIGDFSFDYIAQFSQILKLPEKDSILNLLALYLILRFSRIGISNADAVAVLSELPNLVSDKVILKHIVSSFGEINISSSTDPVKETLLEIIESVNDIGVQLSAAESLGKIDPGNTIAVGALEKLFQSAKNGDVQEKAANSLRTILRVDQMAQSVTLLSPCLNDALNFRPLGTGWLVYDWMWHCVQNLSYPEFYQAWHTPRQLSLTQRVVRLIFWGVLAVLLIG